MALDEKPTRTAALGTQLAPPPTIDRWPIVIGQNLTGAYLSAAFRLCTSGYRHQFVDALNELLEHDGHARGVTRQRVLAVAGARVELDPAKLEPDDPDEELAKTIADECRYQWDRIPYRSQRIASLCWGIIYGLSGLEIDWDRSELWCARGLRFLHSRRLSFPNSSAWDVYIWDQGALVGGPLTSAGLYGLRVKDYPNKFVIHAPQLNGDYPTRDGEGRYIAFLLLIKRIILRASAQDFERTIRPWVVAYFNRRAEGDGKAIASDEDIASADDAVKALGAGSLNAATLPDTVRIDILKAASSLDAQQFLEWIDAQISKSLLGQTFTTEAGKFGSRSTAQVGENGTQVITRYDGACLADTLQEDLFGAIVRLNWPDKVHLAPTIRVVTDEKPDPKRIMELAAQGTSIDMPISIKGLAELTGLPMADPEDPDDDRTRMLMPGRTAAPPDPNESVVAPEADGTEPVDTHDQAAEPPT
jgi:phage gp29-like protein